MVATNVNITLDDLLKFLTPLKEYLEVREDDFQNIYTIPIYDGIQYEEINITGNSFIKSLLTYITIGGLDDQTKSIIEGSLRFFLKPNKNMLGKYWENIKSLVIKPLYLYILSKILILKKGFSARITREELDFLVSYIKYQGEESEENIKNMYANFKRLIKVILGDGNGI